MILEHMRFFNFKSTFYKAVIQYMLQFQQKPDSVSEVMREFFLHFVSQAESKNEDEPNPNHLKLLFALANLMKEYFKLSKRALEDDFQIIQDKKLIETFYKTIGSSNKFVKKAGQKVEKHIAQRIKDYTGESKKILNFLVQLRQTYGYRFNPKNRLALEAYNKLST